MILKSKALPECEVPIHSKADTTQYDQHKPSI